MSEPRETPSSIEINRTAKGDTQYSVKVYCAAGDEDQALEHAKALYADLERTYSKERAA